MGQYADARAALDAASQEFPQDPRFPYFLGRVHEAEAAFDAAFSEYDRAVQLDPTFLRSYVRLASLSLRNGERDEALTYANEAWSSDIQSAMMATEIGETYAELGRTSQALDAYRRALELDATHAQARINLAEFYVETNQSERALAEVEVMLESGVQSPRVTFLHAQSLKVVGENDRAIEELMSLLENDPENANYLFVLGQVHFQAGNFETARQNFSRAYEIQESLVEALYYVGRCDIELGAFEAAVGELTTVAYRSSRGDFHYWLGVALEESGQVMQAFSEYTAAIEDDVSWTLENPSIFYRRGLILFGRGAYTQAYRDFRTIYTLRRDHDQAIRYLGRVYVEQRQFENAVASFERSLELNENQPLVQYDAAIAYLNLDEPDMENARRLLETARDNGLGDTRVDVYLRLGYVYRDLGQTQQAIDELTEFVEHRDAPNGERREVENEIARLQGRR